MDYNALRGHMVLIIEDCRPGGIASGQIGTMEGSFASEMGALPSPRIRLQDGSVIWGYECWWRPVAEAGPWQIEREGLERWKAVLRLMIGIDDLPDSAIGKVALHD